MFVSQAGAHHKKMQKMQENCSKHAQTQVRTNKCVQSFSERQQFHLWGVVSVIFVNPFNLVHPLLQKLHPTLFLESLTLVLLSKLNALFQPGSLTKSRRRKRRRSWGRWRRSTTTGPSWPSRSSPPTSTTTPTMTASRRARSSARWFSPRSPASSDQPSIDYS